MPDLVGVGLSRRDPTAAPHQDQHRGKEGHRCHESDQDRHTQCRTHGGQDAQLGESHAQEGHCDRRSRGGNHLADGLQRRGDGIVRSQALLDVFVISADEEDRIVDARAHHHRGHERQGLIRDTQAHLRQSADGGLSDTQRDPHHDERQHHRHRIAVDDQQDEQNQSSRRDFDLVQVALTHHRQVPDSGGRPRREGLQAGPLGGVLDDLQGPHVGLARFGGGQFTLQAHRQVPRLAVGTRHHLAQRRFGDEVLHHAHIAGVLAHPRGKNAIGLLVGGSQPVLVREHDQQDVLRTRFLE
ncbi:Uncharacterised protein [Mycobacteroides abscessus subsp. abscessus]|nr:Uncharacterised protein [Mycobacteroides abscessus subsp. abscessus]